MQALLAFLALALGSADVYRWTDADGQTHYTDLPHPGAERVTIVVSEPAGDAAQGSSSAGSQAPGSEGQPASAGYQSLTITSPAQEQTLWNIEGQLDVAAAVQPALQPGHALQFYLDGRMAPADPGTTRARFSEVFRGEHALRVEVVDASGSTLVGSPMSRFYVRQTALPKPVAKPKPRAGP